MRDPPAERQGQQNRRWHAQSNLLIRVPRGELSGGLTGRYHREAPGTLRPGPRDLYSPCHRQLATIMVWSICRVSA